MAATIDAEFERIGRTFFPRWNRAKRWRARADPTLDSNGRCKPGQKTILIKSGCDAHWSLSALLVHEICHAVTEQRHGSRWKAKMLDVAEKASKLGGESLASEIRNDVAGTEDVLTRARGGDREAYELIRIGVQDHGWRSWRKIQEVIATEFGIGQADVLKYFPEARQVLDSALREMPR